MSIIDEYTGKTNVVKKAVSKVSDYRERFKQRKILPSEIIAKPGIRKKIVQQDGNLGKFEHAGEKLFFGEGTTQEF